MKLGIPSIIALVLAIASIVLIKRKIDIRIPDHLLGHKSLSIPDLLTEELQGKLLDLLKHKKHIPCNSADLSFYKTMYEDIGEAQPLNKEGQCDHMMLHPNMNRSACILPGRIDIARHYAITGGFNGLKESLESLFSRLQSFGMYLFNIDTEEHAVIRELFHAEKFQGAAKAICPDDKQILDPFQFNFIVQVPGQTVATHLDGVYFWGANRFVFPQWLLAVMAFSGLFKDEFIDQVQVVGYISDWDAKTVVSHAADYGEFVFYDNADMKMKTMQPIPRSGNAIDGSKTVHTTTLYKPGQKAPYLPKDQKHSLDFNQETEEWDLISNGSRIGSYKTSDLRISIVYRARCFRNEEERVLYNQQLKSGEGSMELDDVLKKLIDNAPDGKNAPTERLDLALWLLDTYIRYPYAENTIIPFNYCALAKSYNSAFC